MSEAEREIFEGVVKFYNVKAKFGFIKNLATGEELYVKHSGLLDIVKDDDRVQFEIEAHPKGPKAINVRLSRGSEE